MGPLLSGLMLLTTITTGNAYSKSTVTTNIDGSGEVYTRIESSVNGETKILESSESAVQSFEETGTGKPKPQETVIQNKNLVRRIWEKINLYLTRLKSLFRFNLAN